MRAMNAKTIGTAVFCLVMQVIVIRMASEAWVSALLSGWEVAAAGTVMVLSLAVTGLTIYWTERTMEQEIRSPGRTGETRRDVDAYIDQMLAANGTHLHRKS